jgi:hypothetical protein
MDCLKKYCKTDSLVTKIDRIKLPWSLTLHVVDEMDVCKYCQPERIGKLFPFIEHSVYGIGHTTQNFMYTLPSLFKKQLVQDLEPFQTPKVADWNDATFKDKLDKINEEDSEDEKEEALCKVWKLRNSSKYIDFSEYIVTNTETVTKHGIETKEVRHVVSLGDVSFDEPFKHIISTIRRRILLKPNEDT